MKTIFELSPVFSRGAVLQRRQPAAVFGAGPEGETVRVALGGCRAQAVVRQGRWLAWLPAMEAAQDLVLTAVCGEKTLTVREVAVGEVWVAGGQSNMEFWLRNDAERDTVIPAASDPLLRFFDMPRIGYEGQEKDISFAEYGVWRRFTPAEAGWFSAVGAYFGLALRRALGVPVGIVGCNCGATSASCWLGEEYLDGEPALAFYRQSYEKTLETLDPEQYAWDFRERQAMGQTERMREFDTRMARGQVPPEEISRLLARLTPRQRELLSLPVGPLSPLRPFALYHNMVQKLAPYTAKGVIWYQGEADEVLPGQYAKLFGRMVRCWRDAWGQELPFLTVQLAPFGHWLASTGAAFPTLRAQQRLAADTIPGVWLASVMDAGMEQDIHPKNKRPVGERLALLARGKVYGEADLLCEAPRLEACGRRGDELTLRFANAGDGLRCAADIPEGLEVLADGAPAACTARLCGARLVLRAAALEKAKDIQVNYAQAPYLQADLYNSASLSAEPFSVRVGEAEKAEPEPGAGRPAATEAFL